MPARRTRTGSQSSSSDAAAASRTDSKRATGSSTPRLRSARRSKAAVKRAADDTQSADARAGAGQASAPLLAPTSSLAKENAPRQTVKRSSLTVAPRNSSSGSEVTVAHITIGSVAVFFILFFLLVHDPALPLVASLAKLDVLGVATALQLASFGDRVGGAIGLYIAAFACAVEDAAADREFARAVAVGGANATCAVRGQLMWQRPWTRTSCFDDLVVGRAFPPVSPCV